VITDKAGSGREYRVVSRVRVVHPEFGYVATPLFSRGVMALAVCGLVAGAMSVAIFKSEPNRDPKDAMAFAPAELLIDRKPAQLATQREKRLVVHPRTAVSEQPLIAAVPIGHRGDPAVLPASRPTPIAVGPAPAVSSATPAATETSLAETTSADAAPAAEPAPPPSKSTVRPRSRAHRGDGPDHYSTARSYGAHISGYWPGSAPGW
jgi:hypothetical protein